MAQTATVRGVVAVETEREQRALVDRPVVGVGAAVRAGSALVPCVIEQIALAVRVLAQYAAPEAVSVRRPVHGLLTALAPELRTRPACGDHVFRASSALAVDEHRAARLTRVRTRLRRSQRHQRNPRDRESLIMMCRTSAGYGGVQPRRIVSSSCRVRCRTLTSRCTCDSRRCSPKRALPGFYPRMIGCRSSVPSPAGTGAARRLLNAR
jgi:hypothetical protein